MLNEPVFIWIIILEISYGLSILGCLIVVVSYFMYKELQVFHFRLILGICLFDITWTAVIFIETIVYLANDMNLVI